MDKPDKIKQTVRTLRRALNYEGLYEKDAPVEPFALFEKWITSAVKKEKFEPNAMTLATVSADGRPNARTVLLKDYSPQGFVFYTNYASRKGEDIQAHPQVSVVFYWPSLSRQVLINGEVSKIDREASVEYFHSRPRASQIAAYVSHQSHMVTGREDLEARFKQAESDFKDQDIPCPENWGGYLLVPERIEFWQGRPDRLHDRLCYTLIAEGEWSRERLAP